MEERGAVGKVSANSSSYAYSGLRIYLSGLADGFRVWGLGFEVWGLGFGVQGVYCRV